MLACMCICVCKHSKWSWKLILFAVVFNHWPTPPPWVHMLCSIVVVCVQSSVAIVIHTYISMKFGGQQF